MGLELYRGLVLRAAVIAAVAGLSAAGFISNDAVLLSHAAAAAADDAVLLWHAAAAGRSLLQAKKDCPVNFEGANYTVITSKCKGPLYQAVLCCAALKEFACPYSTYINDLGSNCATAMFSYINLYGKYPPGLFANTCKEGSNGLDCPDGTPQDEAGKETAGATAVAAPAMVALAAAVFAAFILLSV